jgi:flagellar hook protein FlgE
VTGNFFTRAGQTTLDKDGNLVDPNGLKLQGYASDGKGGFTASLGDVKMPTGQLPPKPTSQFTLSSNLNSNDPIKTFDPANPSSTSNTSTTATVYDSLGNAHQVQIYFNKTANGTWDYHAMADGADIQGGTPGTPSLIGTGTMQFDAQGNMQSISNTSLSINFSGGAAQNQAVTLNFGTPPPAGTGGDGVTQTASPDNVTSQKSDGYAAGSLQGVKVDSDGTVNGVYSNGETVAVAKLAIAKFNSNDGLGRAGHNLWIATRDSGQPAMGPAASGGRASVVAGALEQSNVDIAAQFVDMIAHQRSFQANSKTITTADEMLQEVVNLKR